MIRCLIADDELMAHQILEQYIIQTPGLVLVATCRNALEAFAKLQQHAIDLIFLDIELPLVNGISFLKTLPNPPKVIFTTAYAEYALESYELNAVDYLLKPFSCERFQKAIEKVKQLIDKPGYAELTNQDILHLVIKEKEGLIKIPYDDILYVEASRDYMKIVTHTRSYLTHITMKKLEDMLPHHQFIRTHKSYMVALKQIRLVKTESLVLTNNVIIPVSNSYKSDVLTKFHK